MSTLARPLLIRPGARFVCHGDGLCCTDVHLLGPLSRQEATNVRALEPRAIRRLAGLNLLDASTGSCVFLDEAEPATTRCRIYAHDEGRTKPRTCDRYPFLLVATPEGGRVGTDHRCPCRTMGERPLLRPEAAEGPLRSRGGRLMVDRRIGATVPITKKQRARWPRYLALEDELLSSIVRDGVASLGPLPVALEGMSWQSVAVDLALDMPATKWGWACRTFGVFLGQTFGGVPAEARQRPWANIFDRAERRSLPGDPDAMLADFLCDAIWSLEWAWRGPLSLAKAELRVRAEVARTMAASFASGGARSDRAMAEALAIAEIAGVSDAWSTVVTRMQLEPS